MSDDAPRRAPGRTPKLIRPYVLTQGRTKAAGAPLALEASISARPGVVLAPDATPEARRIVELSQEPTSLAELAARLLLPVGVVRILVADLVLADVVFVGAPAPIDAGKDVQLLERLLDGIRAL